MGHERILIIDDEDSIRKVLGFVLREAGYEVIGAASGKEGVELIEQSRPGLVITDIRMGDMDGIEVLKYARRSSPHVPVVILTAFGTVENAVEAMKLGAADYLTKPISRDELKLTVEKALKMNRLERENEDLRRNLEERFRPENIIGLSPGMRSVYDIISRVSTTDASVLITGESGTGKELVARAIHFNSNRRRAPLVTVNCAAIPSELLETELFGHVRGAFTGAVRDKEGKFQAANGGTIFLDEVGAMPPPLQPKLLRVLQDRLVEKVGGKKPIPVDVRIVAATNQDLQESIRKGTFREDLYYRLNVIPIHLPPLRERTSDIPLLVRHFAEKLGGGADIKFDEGAMEEFQSYDWPGNVRELENICERIILLRSSDTIGRGEVSSALETARKERMSPQSDIGLSLDEIERKAILGALRRCNWNKSKAARELSIPRHVLLYRMKKLEIPGKE